MDSDNLGIALESQIHISTMLLGTVRKPSVEPIVLAKRWGITPEKAQNPIQATTQRGIRIMLHPSLSDDSEQMIEIFVIIAWHILYFQRQCLLVQCPKGATDVHKYMTQTLDGLELS